MRSHFLVLVFLFSFSISQGQPPQVPLHTLENIALPGEMNKQVCISGMQSYGGELYFASERCPVIIVFDPVKGTVSRNIPIQVPQQFEMEGITTYKDKLYAISENVAAVYEINMQNGNILPVTTSSSLPPKSKSGDGMEGIAANEKNNMFYLLRERDDDMSHSQIYTFSVEPGAATQAIGLKNESMIELPLENPQWRYSDICVDIKNSRLLCLKSYSKGKFRQQFLESISIDPAGNLLPQTLTNIPVENFTDASNAYKTQDYSMNLEGITIDSAGTIYVISDNTSGKANCDMLAKEKTILLEIRKK